MWSVCCLIVAPTWRPRCPFVTAHFRRLATPATLAVGHRSGSVRNTTRARVLTTHVPHHRVQWLCMYASLLPPNQLRHDLVCSLGVLVTGSAALCSTGQAAAPRFLLAGIVVWDIHLVFVPLRGFPGRPSGPGCACVNSPDTSLPAPGRLQRPPAMCRNLSRLLESCVPPVRVGGDALTSCGYDAYATALRGAERFQHWRRRRLVVLWWK